MCSIHVASDKLLVDKQEEIETLQEKITSLTLQLKEREENISQLMENMKGNELQNILLHQIISLALQSQMLQSAHDPIHHQLSQAELTSQKEPPSDDKPTQGDGLELVSDDKEINEKSQSIQQESSGDHLTKDFIKQSKYVCYKLCANIWYDDYCIQVTINIIIIVMCINSAFIIIEI